MEKTKKPFYKRWWFFVFAFLFLLVMGNLNTGNKAAPTPTAKTQESKEETDPIRAAVDNQHFAYSEYEAINNNGLVKISLHYDKESWDETTFCNSCLTDYINICSELYQIEDINKVEYYVFVDLIDSKGNKDSQKGFSMCMPKDVYSSYTWENMEFMPDSYKQIEADSDIYIYPGIKRNVDFSKMYYKG